MEKNKLLKNLPLFIINFFIIVFYLLFRNYNIILIGNIVLTFFIVLKSKFSLFSIKAILIIYVLIAIAFQYNTGISYGLLQMDLYPLKYGIINVSIYLYLIILYFFITNTDILDSERKKINKKVFNNNFFIFICCITAIAFSIVAFPSLNFTFGSGVRFNSLLPGNAWNHVVVISLIMILPNLKDNKLVKLTYLFCIFWFLIHSERVDMIGVIFLVFVYFSNKIDIKKLNKKLKNINKIILLILIVLVFVIIGEVRSGRKIDLSFEYLCNKILIQNTAADVGYVYNVSIIETENNGYNYGETYLNYIYEIIPFIKSNYDASSYLRSNYSTAGGIFILSEPYMAFGLIGVIIFAIIEFIILNIILKKDGNYTYYIYLYLLATPFRVCWYGLVYIEKGIIYIIPLMLILRKILKKRIVLK